MLVDAAENGVAGSLVVHTPAPGPDLPHLRHIRRRKEVIRCGGGGVTGHVARHVPRSGQAQVRIVRLLLYDVDGHRGGRPHRPIRVRRNRIVRRGRRRERLVCVRAAAGQRRESQLYGGQRVRGLNIDR